MPVVDLAQGLRRKRLVVRKGLTTRYRVSQYDSAIMEIEPPLTPPPTTPAPTTPPPTTPPPEGITTLSFASQWDPQIYSIVQWTYNYGTATISWAITHTSSYTGLGNFNVGKNAVVVATYSDGGIPGRPYSQSQSGSTTASPGDIMTAIDDAFTWTIPEIVTPFAYNSSTTAVGQSAMISWTFDPDSRVITYSWSRTHGGSPHVDGAPWIGHSTLSGGPWTWVVLTDHTSPTSGGGTFVLPIDEYVRYGSWIIEGSTVITQDDHVVQP